MATTDRGARVANPPWCFAIIVGGVAMSVLFVPFTVAHGPTSYNEERLVAGWSMHGWGLLLGTVPNLLIAAGMWFLQDRIGGGRRGVRVAVAVMAAALVLDAAANLGFRGLGAPFVLAVLAPAAIVAAVLIRPAGPPRVLVAMTALAVALTTGAVLGLIPTETSDPLGGYRWFGIASYGLVGLFWAALGLSLRLDRRRLDLAGGTGDD